MAVALRFGLNLLKINRNSVQSLNRIVDSYAAQIQPSSGYGTEVTVEAAPLAIKKQKVSNAMKAYLERARENDEFMKTQKLEYQIGKRHLANMMGEDPETFTQEDIDNAIEYLFPSGLFDKRARPLMKSPEKIFPVRKAAEFDETGRPFHSMFYTGSPNFFKLLFDIVEEMNKLYELEERMLRRGTRADPNQKVDFTGFEWLPKSQLETKLVEHINDLEYTNFTNAMDRLVSLPFSYKSRDFINKFAKPLLDQTKQLEIPKPQFDADGRQFVTTYECLRKAARGDVTIRLPGTGKITINGQDITYFEELQSREQSKVQRKNLNASS
ncbi:28S ribosomal protein S9, mitochondrial-like [Rhagoletis pomonella]|uniref:28S ribosomal protein S9, mitochondrial-like n=1 Tax=Rhagoletis pomonella TaxID=28610 RepID=UPI00178154DF|nr:28S ribosomal protein S9, mitochondrial-like [Rhagoletis pomonella]